MKKILYTLLLTFAAFSANAQFHFGGQFNINFGNQHTDYSNGSVDNKELALQLHLGFISLGWYGTRSNYPDRVVTTSSWDLHKGGFAGILQGLTDYDRSGQEVLIAHSAIIGYVSRSAMARFHTVPQS